MTSNIATDKPTKSTEMAETNLTELPDGEIGGPVDDEVTKSASITEFVNFDSSEFPRLEEVRPGLDCPFYWESDLGTLSYGDHEIDPLSEFEELSGEPSFCLRRFKTQLILCYRNFYKRLVEDSMKNIDEMERIIHLSVVEEGDTLFLGRKDAMLRVVYSCRYFILHSTNQTEEAEKIFEKVKRYMAMDKANQAMSWAIRAAVHVEYGYEPLRTAIECMGSAIVLDGGNAFWPFLKGLYLGRLRRMKNVSNALPENEIENLEMAIKKQRNPVFYSFTAETYLEMIELIEKKVEITESLGSSTGELSSELDKFTKLATRYFIKSVEGKDNSAHLLFRYGRGLMRLRHPHRDLVKAEEFLRRGLKLSPKSSYGNYAMAMLIMDHKKDWEAAQPYLEKSAACRNFHAHLDLCRERFLKDEISVSLELKKLLEIYKEIPKICKIYGELICYQLLVSYNLVKACRYAQSLISYQTTWINHIYYFNSSIFPLSKCVPLLKLLISEIQKELCRESSEMKKNAYKTFLHYILEEGIQTPQNIPANILSRYFEDMKAGMLQHRQFPLVKSEAKKKNDGTKDELRDGRSRNSSSKEYYKYYTATKNRTVCDILPPQTEGRMKEVRRKHRHHFQRRYSGSSSERSASDREIPKHLVKGLESLAISETGTSAGKERISSERFSSRDKRQCSPKVDNHSSRSSRKTVRESGDNRSPNSSLDRKSLRSNRSRRNLVPNPDRNSVYSFQDGQGNSRCARSSPERKSSCSHRERRDPHPRNREDSGSKSCNSKSGQIHRNDESKRRHKRREDSEERSSRPDREYRQRQFESRDDGRYNSSRSRKNRRSSESTHRSGRRTDSEKSSGSERENRRLQHKSRDDRSCSSSRSHISRSGSESRNQSEHRKDSEKSSGSEREHLRRQRRDSDDGSRSSSRSREKRSSSESTRRNNHHKDSDKKSSRSDRVHRHRLRSRRERDDRSYSNSRSRKRHSSSCESTCGSNRYKDFDKKSSRSDREYLYRQRGSRGDGSCCSSRFREERSSSESTSKSKRYKNPDKKSSRSDREHRHRPRRRRDDSYSSRYRERYSGNESTRKSERRKNRDKELSRSDRCRQRRSRDDSCSDNSSRSRQRHSSDESTHRREYRKGHRRERSRRERSYSSDRSRRHHRDENYPERNKSERSY